MVINDEMMRKAKELAEKYFWDYEIIALRVQDVEFSLGNIEHHSQVWIDGDETGEDLNGICATKLDFVGKVNYFGDHAAILAGNQYSYGEDTGEVIIEDAIVLEVLA